MNGLQTVKDVFS